MASCTPTMNVPASCRRSSNRRSALARAAAATPGLPDQAAESAKEKQQEAGSNGDGERVPADEPRREVSQMVTARGHGVAGAVPLEVGGKLVHRRVAVARIERQGAADDGID